MDSYFKLYCYAPVLTWKKGTPDPYFTFDVGTAQERKMARFESMNYFDKALYARFAGAGANNPFPVAKHVTRTAVETSQNLNCDLPSLTLD